MVDAIHVLSLWWCRLWGWLISTRQKGFTLVEILIAIAVVGILAAVAIPKYGDYIKRSKVTDALSITNLARLAMVDYHMKNGRFVSNYGGDVSRRNREIGLQDANYFVKDPVTAMWVGSTGVRGANATSAHIAVRLDHSLGLGSGAYTQLISTIEYKNGTYEFICNNTNSLWPSNIQLKYLPASCHN